MSVSRVSGVATHSPAQGLAVTLRLSTTGDWGKDEPGRQEGPPGGRTARILVVAVAAAPVIATVGLVAAGVAVLAGVGLAIDGAGGFDDHLVDGTPEPDPDAVCSFTPGCI